MTDTQNEGSVHPRIVRGQVDSLSLYEITDYELEILEHGSPNSILLSFAICFISVALSFLTTLLTVKIESIYLFLIFLVFTVVGLAAGIVLIVLWYRTRSQVGGVGKKIRARVPTNSTGSHTVPQSPIPGPTESAKS
jgi:hypothetical protein